MVLNKIMDKTLDVVDSVRDSNFALWATKPVVALSAVTLTGVVGLGALTASSVSAQATKVDNSPNLSVAAASSVPTTKTPSSSASSSSATKKVTPTPSSNKTPSMVSPAETIANFLSILNDSRKTAGENSNTTASSGLGEGSGKPLNSTSPVAIDSLGWPSDFRTITSPYGSRTSPTMGTPDFHTGADFSGSNACGSNIYASESGTVVSAGWSQNGYGNRIIVQHTDKVATTYNHLSNIKVKVGDKVNKGDVIGSMGTTGNSTGCHLHFEVLLDGHIYTDPIPYLIKGAKPTGPDYDINYPAFIPGDPKNPDHADNGDPVNNPGTSTPTPSTPANNNSTTPSPSSSPTNTTPGTPTPSLSPTPSPSNSPTPSVAPTSSSPTPVPTNSSSSSASSSVTNSSTPSSSATTAGTEVSSSATSTTTS